MEIKTFYNQLSSRQIGLIGFSTGLVISSAIISKEWMNLGKYTETSERWVSAQDRALKNPEIEHAYNTWLASLENLRGLPLSQKAAEINTRVNTHMTYAYDQNVYNDVDYWASPAESVFFKKGDCEDYAILKYESLRYLGVTDDECGLLLMKTTDHHDRPSGHAMLMVDVSSEKGYICYQLFDLDGTIITLDKLDDTKYLPTRVVNRSTSHPFAGNP